MPNHGNGKGSGGGKDPRTQADEEVSTQERCDVGIWIHGSSLAPFLFSLLTGAVFISDR